MAEENNSDIILSISSDVASMRRAQKRMDEMLQAMGRSSDSAFDKIAKKANADFKQIEEGAKKLRAQMDAAFNRPIGTGISKGIAAISSILGANELRKMTDAWTDLTSRVNLASGSVDNGAKVMDRLGAMARRTYSDLTQTTESYLASSTALKELGYSTNQSLDYTEALNNALVVSGAKGDRAARVIDALGKSMALGKLSGDQLNTVLADGGRVAEALAAGLGTTTNGLRALGAQGKITGDQIVKALTSQMMTLRREAEEMPATIGDGFTLLNNAMLQYVGNADQVSGASASVSKGLIIIADNFDKVADAGLQVAAVFAGALVGRSMASMVRTLGTTTAALVKFHQTMKAAQGAAGLVQSFGALGAAAAPLGAIIGGAVVLAVGNYAVKAVEARHNSDTLRAEMEKLGLVAPKAADGIDQAAESLDKLSSAERVRKLKNINDEIERLRSGGGRLGSLFGKGDELDLLSANAASPLQNVIQNLSMSDADKSARREIVQLIEDFKTFQISASDAQKKLTDIGNTNVSMGVVELLDKVRESVTGISQLQSYSTRFGNELEANVGKVGEEILSLKGMLQETASVGVISQEQYNELSKLIDEFAKTGRGADALKQRLTEIGDGKPSFDWLHSQFDSLITKMLVVIKTAQDAGRAMQLANPRGPDEAKATRATADPYIVQRRAENAAAEEYERNALRKAQLGKDQFALENKIAEVRRRSESDNQKLTADQIKRIAEAELAGDKARTSKKPKKEKATPKSTDQKIDSDIQAVKDRTAALAAEAEMVGKSTAEQEKRRIAMDLEQAALAKLKDEAIKQGQTDLSKIKISAEQRRQIDEVAEAYGREAAALQLVEDRQQRVEQAANDFYESFKSSTIGAITGANSLADALKNIGNRLADLFLNAGFDALFKPSSGGMGGGAFGGFFNSIGSLIGRKDGGQIPGYDSGGRIRGPGGPRDDKVLLWGSNGEFMMNAAATQKWLPILEAMNAGKLPQRRDGGGIGFSAPRISSAPIPVPSIPSVAQLAGNSSVDNSRTDNSVNSAPIINVNVNGATGNAEVATMVQQGVQQGIMAWQKTPYFANAVSQGVKQANSRGMLRR